MTIPDEIVREVARAIAKANGLRPDDYSIRHGVRVDQWERFKKDAEAALQVAWDAALEEAAKIADESEDNRRIIAAAIRSRKEKP